MLKIFLLCLALSIALGVSAPKELDKWWQHTIVYQIYPRSFQDSDGDGVGDLKGIESRLDHFVGIGVETIWLSPIYKSPMADFGYDISDFKDIDPIFGTLDDFKSMVASAHDRGVNVVLDFVPNHSSDQHEWFQKSLAREDPYTDYYVWLDPKGMDDDGNPIPPNNWVSVFGGPAWTYREERGQFYLHQFLDAQPDLNYRNPSILEEMKGVISFWLDLGVDGFRMDAVFHSVEDEQFRDEPLSGNTDDPNSYGYLDHIYTTNLPETREVLGEFNGLIKSIAEIDGHDRVNMLEIYMSPQDLVPYYEVGDYPFNFGLIGLLDPVMAEDVLRNINDWLEFLPEGKTANWVLGNHDNWRLGSRVGEDLIDAMNMMSLTLPGVAVTYYGEEIGMTNTNVSYEDTLDPPGCRCGPEHHNDIGCSRDVARTPMQWTGSEKNAGFSEADKTWLPVNENFETGVNVETEMEDPNSHLNIYKQLVALRYSDPAFDVGQFKGEARDNVLAFSRTYDPTFYPTFVTLINFNKDQVVADFNGVFSDDVNQGVVLVSTKGTNSATPPGTGVDLGALSLGPNEGLVLYLQPL